MGKLIFRLGNPSPLGLLSFAITTFTLSMYNASFRGITTPNVILGLALGVGGLGTSTSRNPYFTSCRRQFR